MSAKKTCTIQIRCKILLAASHHMPNNICLWENYDPKICLFGQNYKFPCLQYLVRILRNLLIFLILVCSCTATARNKTSRQQSETIRVGRVWDNIWLVLIFTGEARERGPAWAEPHQLSGAVGCRHSARLHLHIVGDLSLL